MLMDKKGLYKNELRDNRDAKLQLEKSRLELEHQERVRDLRIQSHIEDSKAQLKASIGLKYQQEENRLTLDHHRVVREMQLERNEKYKLHKDQSARKLKEEIESHYNSLKEQLIKEENSASNDHFKHHSILKEVQALKRSNKQSRVNRKDMEKSLYYEQLMRQKLAVKFETLKSQLREDYSKSAIQKERDLEQQVEKSEKDLAGIN